MGWSHFASCLLITLLHSIWQSGLLYLFFLSAKRFLHWNNPIAERNGLFFFLLTQLLLSLYGFLHVYSQYSTQQVEQTNQILNMAFHSGVLTRISGWLTGMYLTVLLLNLVRVIQSWMAFRKLVNRPSRKAPVELKLYTRLTAAQLGIRREVRIWLSEHISTPITYGFFKPVILFPVALINQISVQEAEALILHELSHIRRHDYLINWFILAIEQLYFFNPFTRLLSKEFRLSREYSCDLQVLQFRYSPVLYAEALLKTAKQARQELVFHVAASGNTGDLVKRIQFFTTVETDKPGRKEFYKISFLFIGLFLITLLSMWGNKSYQSNVPRNHISKNGYTAHSVTSPTSGLPYKPASTALNGIRVMVIPEENNSNKVINKKEFQQKPEHASPAQQENTHQETTKQSFETIEPLPVTPIAPSFTVIPTSARENEPVKDFIIKEEDPATGTTITKAYKVVFKDGQWKSQFLWMTSETKPLPDSLRFNPDSLFINIQ